MNRTIPGGPLNNIQSFESVPAMLARSAESHPGREAMREPLPDGTWRTITYSDLHREVETMAAAMLAENPSPVVGVVGRNSISWAVVYLAALRSGGIVVPIDRELPFQEMRAILHYSGANMAFFDYTYMQDFLGGPGHGRNLRLIAMNSNAPAGCTLFEEMLGEGEGRQDLLPVDYDTSAPAAIYYTSGTMGQAKGVVLCQRNLIAVVRQIRQFIEIEQDDVFLSVLPMHHTYECSCGFLAPISAGATYIICRGLRYVGEDIANSGATIILAVPLLWEAVYRKIMDGIRSRPAGSIKYRIGLAVAGAAEAVGSSGLRKRLFAPVHSKFGGRIRFLISGGAGIDPEISKGFLKLGFPFLQGYGLTEAAPLVSVNRPGANLPESVGPVLADMDVRIEEKDMDGVGEIVVKGPNVMLGYHNAPEETAKVLSADGWLRTGDFGFVDQAGFLHITGRKKNVIVAKNGKNVYPEEIEAKLNRSDVILECMVFGRESKTKGEEIWVVVVPDMERLIEKAEQKGDSLSTEYARDVIAREIRHFNAGQPIYKHISSFILRSDELPKTTTRKIRRREILKEAGLEPQAVFRI